MLDHNTAVPSAPQAIVPAETVKRVKMTAELLFKLRVTRASIIPRDELDLHHVIEVRAFPCPICLAPIAAIEFSDRPGLHTVDAIPGDGYTVWTADLLTVHECQVDRLWDTYTLSRALDRTRRHCCGTANPIYIDVHFVRPCGQCGRLISSVSLDGAPIEFYDVIVLSCPPEMWLDRHTTPDEYIANLAEPHRCPKEVRQ